MTFAQLFRKFRLRSELSTLGEFANVLAREGLVLEDSTFSRWQNGSRVPKDRQVLLIILNVFLKRGGMTSLPEANSLFESAGQGYLTDQEITRLPNISGKNAPFQVPGEIIHFTGRTRYLTQAKRSMHKKKILFIHGPAGIGKTALAIKLGHLLKDEFSDGVLWSRLDTSSESSILGAIAYTFGENVNSIKDLETRASVVRSLLSTKHVLLIFDNAEVDTRLQLLLPNSPSSLVIITSRSQNLSIPFPHERIPIETFSTHEVLQLNQSILGSGFVSKNESALLEIGNTLGNFPLAVGIMARQILHTGQPVHKLLLQLRKEHIRLADLTYEDKDLYSSFTVAFDHLSPQEQRVFASLAIFAGRDFSAAAVAYLHRLTQTESARLLEQLVDKSLVERSVESRYRLHPLVKFFAREKIGDPQSLASRAADYFTRFMARGGRGNSAYFPTIGVEVDNILGIFRACWQWRDSQSLIKLWEYLGLFLWDTGQWTAVEEYGWKVIAVCRHSKNDQAMASCYIDELSWLYFWYGDLDRAQQCLQSGKALLKTHRDDRLLALAQERLGMILQARGQNSEAEKTLKQTLTFWKRFKFWPRVASTCLYIGHTYKNRNDLTQATRYYRLSQRYAKKNPEHEAFAIALYYLGDIFYLQKDYARAESNFKKALTIDQMRQRKPGFPWCLYGIGRVAFAKGNTYRARQLFLQAKELFIQLGISEQIKNVRRDLQHLPDR